MKKIKLYLEYRCYPMWIYDEQDELVDNAIVPELIYHTSIVQALDQIQAIYDRLFKDNNISFEFEGFTEQQDKEDFLKLVSETTFLIENQLKNDYKIENKIMI
ncbi:hypothetical protein QE450_003613 [Paenibacillus sp. SORGH_AS306]|uniref:hypothetical protein n=1 Tax=unclassified Paenibacillus TaxID=185978 RepID=UPI0027832A5B|nr:MULTISPECIES: hypothetical protein [unclassified Paenibacillus]MDQ1236115.1 hypothetical protein [Paenibacillus sp. SORGH_AS_0306]MDR6108470.1 hypothetical protein [Paenibacillus sp. SORGH_AS_0338]